MPLATASMISIFALVEIKRFCINEISLSSNLYRCISFALRMVVGRWLDINGFMRKLENWATLTGSARIFQFHTHGRCYCFILHLQKKKMMIRWNLFPCEWSRTIEELCVPMIRISASRTLVVCILCNVASEAGEIGFTLRSTMECQFFPLLQRQNPDTYFWLVLEGQHPSAKVLYCNVIWIYRMKYASDHVMWCLASVKTVSAWIERVTQCIHKSSEWQKGRSYFFECSKTTRRPANVIFGGENAICSVSLASYLLSRSQFVY